ncbi:hypothetical protein N658DRAFT_435392, partial [Parathielavia hyrcaniae]
MADANSNSAITPATFRQLYGKIPTETFREILSESWRASHPHEDDITSDKWLDEHAKGFLLIQNLRPNYPIGKSILLESLDTGVLVVNKRFSRQLTRFKPDDPDFDKPVYHYACKKYPPVGLRFSTLDDPRVAARLPAAPYFTRLYAYGLPQGKASFKGRDPDDMYSLYFRHYNGSTLSSLMEMYGDSELGGPVPEPFVWHVMDQLCRAVLSLRAGDGQPHTIDKHNQDWVSVVHRGITEDNILLHFRDDDDEPLARCFPAIVLGGFGAAIMGRKLQKRLNPISTADAVTLAWQDLYVIGELCCRLVTNHDAPTPPRQRSMEHAAAVSKMLSRYLPENMNLAARQKLVYSRELIELLQRFERLKVDNQNQGGAANMLMRDLNPIYWKFFLECLGAAMNKVEQYRVRIMKRVKLTGEADDDVAMADVSWVKPDPTFDHAPYHPGDGNKATQLERLRKDMKCLFGP